MEARTRYARSGDAHIAYRVFGNGPGDIVLVPGTVSHVELYWELPANAHLLERLASFARVIIFDKRGQGLSDRVADHTLAERVGDALAVMDAAGSSRATVYGCSEGGQLALTLAAMYPERVSGLVLYGTYASMKAPPWSVTREKIEEFLMTIATRWGEGALVHVNAPRRVEDTAFVEWFGRLERAVASPNAILALMRANYEIDVSPMLPSIRVPTVILHRAGDGLVPVEAGRYLARNIPGAKYVELPGDDHMLLARDHHLLDTVLDQIDHLVTGRRLHADPEPMRREVRACGDGDGGVAALVARAEAVVAAARRSWRESEAQFIHAIETFRAIEELDAAIEGYRRQDASQSEHGPRGLEASASARAVFRREGDYWTVSWRGNVVRVKDAKGLHYIAYLLAHPGRRVLACELAAAGAAPGNRRASIDPDATTTDLGDAGAMIDARARVQYRHRMGELHKELADAVQRNDTISALRLRSELEVLRDQLAAAIGLGGRERKAASHTERARLMVTKAIKAAIARLRASDPSLGRYLATSIKTGTLCAYEPDSLPPVSWHL